MKSLKQTASTIVVAGLIAGTIDVGAACLINSAHPVVILHAIASGLIGKPARSGGMSTAALGLVLQWAMSMLIAAIYLGVTASHPERRRRWVSSGILAGIVIFVVMNYLVVPLSAAPFRPPFTVHGLLHAFSVTKLIENLLAMLLFGLIIAYSARGKGR
jgi:uncharacterized membrane protein YagU involved in acid resistance